MVLLIIVIVQMQFMYCDSASCATFAFFLVLPFFLHDSPSKPYFIRYSLKSSFLLRDSLRSLFLFCHTWVLGFLESFVRFLKIPFRSWRYCFLIMIFLGFKSFLGFSSQLNSQGMLCGMWAFESILHSCTHEQSLAKHRVWIRKLVSLKSLEALFFLLLSSSIVDEKLNVNVIYLFNQHLGGVYHIPNTVLGTLQLLNLCNNHMTLLLFLCYYWENWNTEGLSNVLKVIRLIHVRASVKSRKNMLLISMFWFHSFVVDPFFLILKRSLSLVV